MASVVKNLPPNAGDIRDAGSIPGSGRYIREAGSIPGSGRCPEEVMVTDFSILAWRIPCTEEPGGHRVRHD